MRVSADHEETLDPIGAMAAAYGVRSRDLSKIARCLRKSCLERRPALSGSSLKSFAQVVGILALNDPEQFEKVSRGSPPADWLRKMMLGMVAAHERDPSHADVLVDTALTDIAERLRA